MQEFLLSIVNGIPKEIGLIIIAMIPIGELRGSIPIGIGVFKMNWITVFVLSVIGNMIPVFFVMYLIEPIYNLLKKIKFFDKFFTWLFERTRKKFYAKHKSMGDIALIFFVGIPLPVTGAWTGSLAAWLFGIPPKKALPLIFFGVIMAGVIVTIFSMGIISIF
ncbi:MAG: small multi-drug export protein [Patescibacteria group bacterium]